MNRVQKEAVITALRNDFRSAGASFLVEYQGATVELLKQFRTKLRSNDAKFKVAKARLMRLAASDLPGADLFSQQFANQVGLVFASGDVSAAAKDVAAFAKDHESIKILAGYFEQNYLSEAEVVYLAMLPSRDVLLGQVVGTIQAPIAMFVRLLGLLIVRLLYVLKRIAEQKEAQSA